MMTLSCMTQEARKCLIKDAVVVPDDFFAGHGFHGLITAALPRQQALLLAPLASALTGPLNPCQNESFAADPHTLVLLAKELASARKGEACLKGRKWSLISKMASSS